MNSSPLQILLIDDDEDDYIITRDLLAEMEPTIGQTPQAHFELEWVDTYQAGIKAISQNQHDVYLIDYYLGEYNGLMLLQEAIGQGCQAPLILLTSRDNRDVDLKAMEAGAADYLVKEQMDAHLLERSIRYAIERKHTEHQLQQNQYFIQRITETTPHLTYVFNIIERKIVYLNKSLPGILGYSAQQAQSFSSAFPSELLHPEDKTRFDASRKHLDAIQDGDIIKIQFRMKHADGNWRWFSSSDTVFSRLPNGQVHEIMGTAQDITERKQAEFVLQQSEERFRATFEQAAVGIAHVGLDGRWLRVNQRLCEILGYDREDLLQLTFQEITHPDSREESAKYIRQLIDGEIKTYTQEDRYIHNNGRLVWSNITVSLAGNIPDQPNYLITVIEDISRRKQLEEQLRQSQKLEAIGQLAGGVAHDFNNILTVIIGNCEIMLEELQPDNAYRKDIGQIYKAAQRAASLTRQLLAFSRQQVLQPQEINLNNIIREVQEGLPRLIGENIELKTNLASNLGTVKADPGQIEQVLLNLVFNARDAMATGGRLVIKTDNIHIDNRQFPNIPTGAYTLLSITDTGEGMNAETQARVFEPFFTTKEQGEGTGLGLATVHGIITQSEGYIWIESEPGQGTTFNILLPQIYQIQDTPRPALPSQRTAQQTILVVDVEETVRNITCRILQKEGFNTLAAVSYSEALRIAQEANQPIHILLSDTAMPGAETRQHLLEHFQQIHPVIKVILMSAYTDTLILDQSTAGVKPLMLQKPFTPEVLIKTVQEALGTHQTHQDDSIS